MAVAPPPALRAPASHAAAAAVFLASAALLATMAPWNRALSWPTLLLLGAAYAVASRVRFPVTEIWTDASQLVFVPMLFLLPTPLVPAVAAAAFLIAHAKAVASRPLHLLSALGDSIYALGPATVFVLADVREPDVSHWWVYLAALAAQILLGTASCLIRDRVAYGESLSLRGLVQDWTHLTDTLLSALGLLSAIAATKSSPGVVLLSLPLFGLLALFARDRRGRVETATELSSAYRGTAMLLGDVVEADHTYTGSHSRDVVELSLAVAKKLRLNAARRRAVEFGALLHDVGKIAVPKDIIDKPGPLDDEEWAIMKRHTIEGQRMLDRVGGALSNVGVVVRASHEHYDGGGYPDGLRGTQIPIEARIVACCDAYSAMTTDRAYRRAMSRDDAIAELRRVSGTQFDPKVVSALIGVLGSQAATEDPVRPDQRSSVGILSSRR